MEYILNLTAERSVVRESLKGKYLNHCQALTANYLLTVLRYNMDDILS